MEKLKTVLKWFYGILFIIFGVFSIPSSIIIALLLIFLGLFLMPSSFNIIQSNIDFNFTSASKWVVLVGGIFLVGFALTLQTDANDEEVDKLVEEASGMIDSDDLFNAKAILKEAKSKYSLMDNKALELEVQITKSQSLEFAMEQLTDLDETEFKALEEGKLKKSILSQTTLNSNLINVMTSLIPERDKIAIEVQEKREQERLAVLLENERQEREGLDKERKEIIGNQFSTWDGSHPDLTRKIKENMNDPDSYDHIETHYQDKGSTLIVVTKFRGTNAFGAKVINSVTASVDFESNVLEIISQN